MKTVWNRCSFFLNIFFTGYPSKISKLSSVPHIVQSSTKKKRISMQCIFLNLDLVSFLRRLKPQSNSIIVLKALGSSSQPLLPEGKMSKNNPKIELFVQKNQDFGNKLNIDQFFQIWARHQAFRRSKTLKQLQNHIFRTKNPKFWYSAWCWPIFLEFELDTSPRRAMGENRLKIRILRWKILIKINFGTGFGWQFRQRRICACFF